MIVQIIITDWHYSLDNTFGGLFFFNNKKKQKDKQQQEASVFC